MLIDVEKDGIYHACTPSLLAQAFSSLISFYTFQIWHRTGNEEDYFDSQIHKFKLSLHSGGPQTRGRYYGVERIGALPPPFPKKATPTSVFTITLAALNRKSPQARALPYFNGMLNNIHQGLVRLVHATFDASVAAFPHDPTIPKQWPSIKHVLLPSVGDAQAPDLGKRSLWPQPTQELTSADIAVPLSAVKWHELFPENGLLGGDELVSAIQAGNHRRRTSLLFFHPAGDPRLSPVAWVPLTQALHQYSTIAYAFPYDWSQSKLLQSLMILLSQRR